MVVGFASACPVWVVNDAARTNQFTLREQSLWYATLYLLAFVIVHGICGIFFIEPCTSIHMCCAYGVLSAKFCDLAVKIIEIK